MAETSMIRPSTIPSEPRKMNSDYGSTVSPNLSLMYFFRAQLDVNRMKEAFGRVVSNNPELAGRFRSKPFGQLSFEGAVGVPFHVVRLSDEHQDRFERMSAQQVAAEPLQSLKLLSEVGLVFSKWGEKCKDTDEFGGCTITVAQGSALAIVVLSISHAIVDAKAYYDILRAWDSEYDVPNSTKPMTVRYDITKKMEQTNCCCMLAGLGKFIWPLMSRMNKMQTQSKMDSVAVYSATSEKYNAMKQAELQMSEGKKRARTYSAQSQQVAEDGAVHISGNDAHLAFLGNALKAKVIQQMMNARGQNPMVRGEPIPDDYLGNALASVGASSLTGGNFDAMKFRKSLALHKNGLEGVNCFTLGCFGYHEYVLPTSWAKVQHKPKFGTRTGCYQQIPHVGEWMVYAMNINVHVQTCDDGHIFIQTALTPEQAESLQRACAEKGFVCTILSAAEVTNYWKSGANNIHV